MPVVGRLEAAGRTVVVVSVDGVAVGVLGLVDQPRPGAATVIERLRTLTGREPVLLTGDNAGAAQLLAEEVGITEVEAGLLPHEKVSGVRALRADGTIVAVVGDGINDAPALTTADLGIALGRGAADLTLDAADVIVVNSHLTSVPASIELSRRAQRIVVQNLVFASVVIGCLVAIDLVGHLPLPLGVAGHEGSTVVVGLNGLRLLLHGSSRR